MLGARRPRCPRCEAELSVVHVVDHCTAFTAAGPHHGLVVPLREALQEDGKRTIIDFLIVVLRTRLLNEDVNEDVKEDGNEDVNEDVNEDLNQDFEICNA